VFVVDPKGPKDKKRGRKWPRSMFHIQLKGQSSNLFLHLASLLKSIAEVVFLVLCTALSTTVCRALALAGHSKYE